MFIQTVGIEIDTENSKTYGSIYTTAGSYSGVNVRGHMSPMILNYECDATIPVQTVNLYADLTRQTINIFVDETCPKGIHLGGAILTSDGCSCEVFAFLQREDKCLVYKRAFGSSFNTAYNEAEETINICESVLAPFDDNYYEDFETDIIGSGLIVDGRVYGGDADGTDGTLADGNVDVVDGNLNDGNLLTP